MEATILADILQPEWNTLNGRRYTFSNFLIFLYFWINFGEYIKNKIPISITFENICVKNGMKWGFHEKHSISLSKSQL